MGKLRLPLKKHEVTIDGPEVRKLNCLLLLLKIKDIAVDKDTDYPEGVDCIKTNLILVWLEF